MQKGRRLSSISSSLLPPWLPFALLHGCCAGLAASAGQTNSSTRPLCEDSSIGYCGTCPACCVHLSAEACAACIEASCHGEQLQCDAHTVEGCTACEACCHPWFAAKQSDCDACAVAKCGQLVDCANPELLCSVQCGQKCWSHLSSPCLQDCVGRHGAYFVLVALLPYLGRLLLDWLWATVKAKARKLWKGGAGGEQEEGERPEQQGDGEAPLLPTATSFSECLTMEQFLHWRGDFSFVEARAKNGQSSLAAVLVAAVRLFLWHALQPVIFLCLVRLFWAELSPGQHMLASAVALRELLYLFWTIRCALKSPCFLLIDISATVRSSPAERLKGGFGFLLVYVLAPDKFVYEVALATASKGWESIHTWSIIASFLFDLGSCMGLVNDIAFGGLPPALVAGYACTSVSTVLFLIRRHI